MNNQDGSIETFQNQVIEAIEFIESHEASKYVSYKPAPGAPDPYEARRWRQRKIDEATNEAEKILKKPEMLKHICPALKSISGDAFEISKILVGVLLPLGIAGIIAIPLHPLIFGVIAIMISRAGIASICDKYYGG